jgi:arginine/lysine/ornithine decarboxylase
MPLIQALIDYQGLDRFRFHVPGHAGRPVVEEALGIKIPGVTAETFLYDQTEVEGLDVLSEPEGCLLEAQKAAAEAFGVASSFFLVNGSSAGLIAGLLAWVRPGEAVLVPRNAHRSVLSGLILTGARPIWFAPEWLPEWGLWGQVTADTVASLLDAHPEVRVLVVTSPTYEGIGSDIPALAALCRQRNVSLIVDEAHGALWPFSDRLPPTACQSEVDLVVQSLHKTAGSLTQTAIAHIPKGSRLSPERYQQALNMVQTTSPSYLLMASLDATRAMLVSPEGGRLIDQMLDQVICLRQAMAEVSDVFQLFGGGGWPLWDPTRFYVKSRFEPGTVWAPRLEADQRLTYESTFGYGSLYIATLGLVPQDYQGFLAVFRAEAERWRSRISSPELYQPATPAWPLPIVERLPREAFFTPIRRLPAAESVGAIAGETVVHCPPGMPILLPGETIQSAHLPWLPQTVAVLAD